MENGSLAGIQADPRLKGPFTTEITDPYQLDQLTGYSPDPYSPLNDRCMPVKPMYGTGLPEQDFFGNPISGDEKPKPGINDVK